MSTVKYLLIPAVDYRELYVEVRLAPDRKIKDILRAGVESTVWINNEGKMLIQDAGQEYASELIPLHSQEVTLPSLRIKTPRGELYRALLEKGMGGVNAYNLVNKVYNLFPATHRFDNMEIEHFYKTYDPAKPNEFDMPPFIGMPDGMEE